MTLRALPGRQRTANLSDNENLGIKTESDDSNREENPIQPNGKRGVIRNAFRSIIAQPSSPDTANEDGTPFLLPIRMGHSSLVPYDSTGTSGSESSRAGRPHAKKPDKDKNYSGWLSNTREATIASNKKVVVNIPPFVGDSDDSDDGSVWLLGSETPAKRKRRRQQRKKTESRSTCKETNPWNVDYDYETDTDEDDDPPRGPLRRSAWMNSTKRSAANQGSKAKGHFSA